MRKVKNSEEDADKYREVVARSEMHGTNKAHGKLMQKNIALIQKILYAETKANMHFKSQRTSQRINNTERNPK